MSRRPPEHPALQDRSKATLDRLVAAAEVVLDRDGLDAATVAAVAEEAGMSVGIVYKRFTDKDGLFRVVFERFFERAAAINADAVAPERWANHSAATIIDALVAGAVRAYSERRGLLRSLILFAETHPDPRFKARAEELRSDVFRGIGQLLLDRRREIGHPDPEHAVPFALLMLGLALRGVVLDDRRRSFKLAQSERALAGELSRLVKGYLSA